MPMPTLTRSFTKATPTRSIPMHIIRQCIFEDICGLCRQVKAVKVNPENMADLKIPFSLSYNHFCLLGRKW